MYRILALLLLVSVVLLGCAAEPTATPEPTLPPTDIPTDVPTTIPQPTATSMPTVAPTDTPPPTNTPTPLTGVVKSTLNVREQPTTRARLLGVLKGGDVVTLVGRNEDTSWLQINFPLGETTTAWVLGERIETTANLAGLPAIPDALATVAPTQVAVEPTTQVTTTPGETAVTPNETPSATTEATTAPTGEATTVATTEPTTAPAETPQPPAPGGAPPGSILFDTYENGEFNIYRVRADGTGQQQLITGGSEPALSPDGSRIAYRMRRDVGGLGIGMASSTGAFQSIVTEESTAGYPTWSADGNNLAYNMVPGSERLPATLMRIGVGAGNSPVRIGDGWRPAWQPNNSPFMLYDGCKGATDCGSILTLNAFDGDPNNPTLVTFGSAGAWSPTGSQIAFQAPDDKGNTQIWIVNADGSNRTQITTDTGTHGMPIWSSDGQWLFYRTDQGGTGWAIYAIRTNGTDARKIVDSNVHPNLWVYAKLAIAP